MMTRAKERYQISFLLSRGVDGLIVNTTSYENPFLVNLRPAACPLCCATAISGAMHFDIVTTDHASTIQQLLAHLKGQAMAARAVFPSGGTTTQACSAARHFGRGRGIVRPAAGEAPV